MHRWIRSLAVATLLAGSAIAQFTPDRDLTALPAGSNPAPNGTRVLPSGQLRNAYYVTSLVTWVGSRRSIGAPNGPCDLVVAAGGTLDISHSLLSVYGDVVLEPGGLLRVRDSEFTLRGAAPHDYGYHFVGGQLETLRSAIGGNPVTGAVSNFFLDKGLWTARDTVVSHTGGILVGSALGRFGDPLRDGGTLLADGLVAGVGADFVHLSGKGNATLHNSTMRISLRFFDNGPAPNPIPLVLPNDQLVAGPVVLGDPTVHDGTNRPAVTTPIAGSPWRLELVNTTVSKWHVQFFDAGAGTNPRTYVFQNTPQISIGVIAEDLVGSPIRSGPWANFYPSPYELPGLPTVSAPGYHGMPPGCGVTVGSVTLRSGANDTTKVTTWDLYLNGNSNYTITGPGRIGEVLLNDDARLTLQGVEGFDAGLRCITAQITGNSRLIVRDATVGSTGTLFGDLRASGQAVADLDRVRVRRLSLRTVSQSLGGPLNGVDAGTITLGHHVRSTAPGETLTVQTSPGGTITVADDEFVNSDFEGLVVGGTPAHWSTTNANCPPSPVVSPSSPGIRSVTYTSGSASGSLSRTAVLPPRTTVEVYAWVHPLTMPAGGSYTMRLRDGTGSAVARNLPTSGGWRFVALPPFTVSPGQNQVTLEFVHSGASGTVSFRVDDVAFRIPGYWESDNLLNLGFEEIRKRNNAPSESSSFGPDYWRTIFAESSAITTGLRPGATGRAIELAVNGQRCGLRKDLYFLRPGQQITVTGWLKGIAAGGGTMPLNAYIGSGETYWNLSIPSNQWQWLPSPAQWTQFSLTYTVPQPPEFQGFTAIAIVGGTAGDLVLADDFTVTFQ